MFNLHSKNFSLSIMPFLFTFVKNYLYEKIAFLGDNCCYVLVASCHYLPKLTLTTISAVKRVYTKRGFSEAEALNANLVLLRLNTYGGELSLPIAYAHKFSIPTFKQSLSLIIMPHQPEHSFLLPATAFICAKARV